MRTASMHKTAGATSERARQLECNRRACAVWMWLRAAVEHGHHIRTMPPEIRSQAHGEGASGMVLLNLCIASALHKPR